MACQCYLFNSVIVVGYIIVSNKESWGDNQKRIALGLRLSQNQHMKREDSFYWKFMNWVDPILKELGCEFLVKLP